jgi:hypothetical protein
VRRVRNQLALGIVCELKCREHFVKCRRKGADLITPFDTDAPRQIPGVCNFLRSTAQAPD